ncbi:hypothetical protein D3C73_971540 [compost metagenome]
MITLKILQHGVRFVFGKTSIICTIVISIGLLFVKGGDRGWILGIFILTFIMQPGIPSLKGRPVAIELVMLPHSI